MKAGFGAVVFPIVLCVFMSVYTLQESMMDQEKIREEKDSEKENSEKENG